MVSTLQGVKSFVDKADRRIVLVGAEGPAADLLRQAFTEVEVAADLAEVLDRPAAERPEGLMIEASALPVPQLVDHLKQADGRSIPAVVYAPEELEPDDDRRLRLAVFGGLVLLARTPDQLVEQASLMLHEPVERMSDGAKAKLNQNKHEDPVLTGRKIVVIDDDIRNIFSLASALEEYGIELSYAESGRAGLEVLDAQPEVDVVLVDILMPDMDGYETIREIRSRAGLADLPVVAVVGQGEPATGRSASRPVSWTMLLSKPTSTTWSRCSGSRSGRRHGWRRTVPGPDAASEPDVARPSPPSEPSVDEAGGRERRSGDAA